MDPKRHAWRASSDPSAAGGVLIVRVWFDGPPEHLEMRIRLVGRRDVSSDVETVKSVATVPDSLAYIKAWMEQFIAPLGSSSPSQSPEPVGPQ